MGAGECIFGALEGELLLVLEPQALDECLGCGELGLEDLPLSQERTLVGSEIREELSPFHLLLWLDQELLRVMDMADCDAHRSLGRL